jgi:Protein of unknown function (DUF1488)
VAMITCPAYFDDRSLQDEVRKCPSSTVRCFVTRAALTDKAQGSGQAESLHIFHEYRSEIENLASAKYDAGKITSDGVVVVDSPDLNPEQFQ